MKCPKCRRVQYFVCGDKQCVCHKRIQKGKRPQKVLKHDAVQCPYCGFTAHMDYWGEREMQFYHRQTQHRGRAGTDLIDK